MVMAPCWRERRRDVSPDPVPGLRLALLGRRGR